MTADLVLVAALIIAMVVLVRSVPRAVEGSGTLDECEFGWPVIVLTDEWDAKFPGDQDPYYLPVMSWPEGTAYDEETGEFRDLDGGAQFSLGDKVSVAGSIRNMEGGDIPPCFLTRGIDIDEIQPASTGFPRMLHMVYRRWDLISLRSTATATATVAATAATTTPAWIG